MLVKYGIGVRIWYIDQKNIKSLRAIDHKSDTRPAQPISPNFLFFCWLIGLMEGVNGGTNFWGSGALGGCGGGGLLFSSWRGGF